METIRKAADGRNAVGQRAGRRAIASGFGARCIVVALALFATILSGPAASQDDPAPTSTAAPTTASPTTEAPTTTSAPASAAPTTNADEGATTPSSSTPTTVGEQPATTSVGAEADAESTTTVDPGSPEATDPLVDEGPAETVPEVDVEVPDSNGRYANQPDFEEATVLWGSVLQAEERLAEAEEDHIEAVARVKALRLRLKQLRYQIEGFDAETRQAIEELEAAEALLELRALTAFVRGDSFEAMTSIDHDAILDSMAQQTMIESVFDQDEDAIGNILELRDSLGVDVAATYDRLDLVEQLEADAVLAVEEAFTEIDQANLELRAFEAGSEVFIDGLVFPVGDGVEVPLIDSFGFPRMTGTPDEHWHEGIDIFAPTGTPLLATERGIITRIGTGRLGGLKLWLRGESGTDWYYAHLSAFNPDLREGDLVEAGDLVGYVGQSGNAVGTPPHLHMQMHPGGGRPVNPYPLLNMRLELDAEAALAEQSDS